MAAKQAPALIQAQPKAGAAQDRFERPTADRAGGGFSGGGLVQMAGEGSAGFSMLRAATIWARPILRTPYGEAQGNTAQSAGRTHQGAGLTCKVPPSYVSLIRLGSGSLPFL